MTIFEAFMWMAVAICAWTILGCIVLSLLDRDERVLRWIQEAPLPWLKVIAIWAWPGLVGLILWDRFEIIWT